MIAVGCGDDSGGNTTTTATETGTTAGDSTSAQTGTTEGADTTAGSSTTAASDSTSGDPSGTTSGSSSGSSDSGSEGSSSDSSTGAMVVDVPFSVIDTFPIARATRAAAGWTVITTEADWTAQTGAPVPAGVTFPEQWVVYGSLGPQPFPGHALDVAALGWDGATLSVDGDQLEPGADCETYQFTWPADTALVIDALDAEVATVDDGTMPLMTSCAAGVGDSGGCDLSTPCATGLLCAGLIRSTVLANSPGGLCLPETYAGVFAGDPVMIPADGHPYEGDLDVTGLTTVDMDVVIWVELDHPAPEELIIGLRNPDGNEVSVANQQTSPLHPGGIGIVPIGFSGDESVNGTWSLLVEDPIINGNNGSVLGWELEIMSRFD